MDPVLATRIAKREKILDRIRGVLIEQLHVRRDPDEIDPDTPLFGGGLALDSIDSVDLLIHLQTDFGVEIPDDRARRATLRTVNSLVDVVLAVEEDEREP